MSNVATRSASVRRPRVLGGWRVQVQLKFAEDEFGW